MVITVNDFMDSYNGYMSYDRYVKQHEISNMYKDEEAKEMPLSVLEYYDLIDLLNFYFSFQKLEKEDPAAAKRVCQDRYDHFNKQYEEWFAEHKGEVDPQDIYFDKILAKQPHIEGNLFKDATGKYYKAYQLVEKFFVKYDTKIVLYGDYIRVYSQKYYGYVRRYEEKTDLKFKCYEHKPEWKRSKFMDTLYANENVLITWCVLEFKENVTPKEANKSFDAWKRKIPHKDFKYMRVLEPGNEDVENIHFNVFCSLNIGGADKEMFVKSARKGKKYEHEHNLTNWKYGFTTAYPVRSYDDLKRTGLYSTKYIEDKHFEGKERNSSESQGLIKPKVFYFNSNSIVDQEKIDVLLKGALEIDGWSKKGFYYTMIDVRVYKRDLDGTLSAKMIEDNQEEEALMEQLSEGYIAYQEAEEAYLSEYQEAIPNISMIDEESVNYEQIEDWYEKFVAEDEALKIQREVFAYLMDGKEEAINYDCFEQSHCITNDAVAIYISTPRTSKKYVNQLEKDKVKLTGLCKSKGYPIHNMFIDFGNSGRSADRLGYQQMMVDLKDGKFSRIVTISTNMIVSHPTDYYQLLLDTDKYNCNVETSYDNESTSLLFNGNLPDIMREQIQGIVTEAKGT